MMRPELSLPRFDPFDPEFLPDPYPCYQRFRAADPVHSGVPPFPTFRSCHYVFRHDDVVNVLKDPRLGRDRLHGGRAGSAGQEAIARLGRQMVLFRDPPDQLRMRTLLATAFSPDFIRALGPRTEAVARRLAEAVSTRAEFDLMAELAVPLPVLVIASAMGLPDEDADLIKAWSDDLIAVTDPHRSNRVVAHADGVVRDLMRYLRDIIVERRREPGQDLISRMLVARRNGDRLSEDEVVANAMLLLSAGHETTTGLLGNGILALLRQRDQWERLRCERELLPLAVEELLRYDSPIQMTFRFAAEPVILGGRRIEAGEAVAAVIGSANRDPEVFVDPDRLDVGRGGGRHVAFGAGTHFCMGPSLARLEAQIALDALLDSVPDLRLAGEPTWRETTAFRSLARLPLAS